MTSLARALFDAIAASVVAALPDWDAVEDRLVDGMDRRAEALRLQRDAIIRGETPTTESIVVAAFASNPRPARAGFRLRAVELQRRLVAEEWTAHGEAVTSELGPAIAHRLFAAYQDDVVRMATIRRTDASAVARLLTYGPVADRDLRIVAHTALDDRLRPSEVATDPGVLPEPEPFTDADLGPEDAERVAVDLPGDDRSLFTQFATALHNSTYAGPFRPILHIDLLALEILALPAMPGAALGFDFAGLHRDRMTLEQVVLDGADRTEWTNVLYQALDNICLDHMVSEDRAEEIENRALRAWALEQVVPKRTAFVEAGGQANIRSLGVYKRPAVIGAKLDLHGWARNFFTRERVKERVHGQQWRDRHTVTHRVLQAVTTIKW